MARDLAEDPLIGQSAAQVRNHPMTTREGRRTKGGSATTSSGRVVPQLGLAPWVFETDRVMIRGSMALNTDILALRGEAGRREVANGQPGEFVVENAFLGEGR